MGRIRTKFIKNLSEDLVAKYPGKFSIDFKKNVETLKELKIIEEKFTRNKLAGYIVQTIKKKKF
ncbi:MAG: 30S ribosomal protein S17e [Candidatus Aenigmatarchaeota archaeon]